MKTLDEQITDGDQRWEITEGRLKMGYSRWDITDGRLKMGYKTQRRENEQGGKGERGRERDLI